VIWTFNDFDAGLCSVADVGKERPPEPTEPPPPAPAFDKDDPNAVRAKLIHEFFTIGSERFSTIYGPSAINKLMDIAVKEDRPERLPPVTDAVEWDKLLKTAAKMVDKEGSFAKIATPALHLCFLNRSGGDPFRMAQMILDTQNA
jgi:hypothetical protein